MTHRGDPRTDDIRPRDDETFLTSSQGRLHDDCRFQVKNIKIPSNSFIHACFIYWQERFHFFFSSEVCGTDPPFSCPIHVFDGQDDVKHNLEGIIFCLFFKITNKDVITINYTFYSRLHLFSQSLILCALFYIFGNAKSISVLVTV